MLTQAEISIWSCVFFFSLPWFALAAIQPVGLSARQPPSYLKCRNQRTSCCEHDLIIRLLGIEASSSLPTAIAQLNLMESANVGEMKSFLSWGLTSRRAVAFGALNGWAEGK